MSKSTPLRLKALAHAATYVGVSEQPLGSNDGPQVRVWLKNVGITSPAPWCAAFMWSMFKQAGVELPIPGAAAVESWEQWGEASGDIVTRPFKGDVVCYDWNADNWYDHVGIVEKVLALRWRGRVFAGWVRTIEGNSGDRVTRQTRWIQSAKFIRIPG